MWSLTMHSPIGGTSLRDPVIPRAYRAPSAHATTSSRTISGCRRFAEKPPDLATDAPRRIDAILEAVTRLVPTPVAHPDGGAPRTRSLRRDSNGMGVALCPGEARK